MRVLSVGTDRPCHVKLRDHDHEPVFSIRRGMWAALAYPRIVKPVCGATRADAAGIDSAAVLERSQEAVAGLDFIYSQKRAAASAPV